MSKESFVNRFGVTLRYLLMWILMSLVNILIFLTTAVISGFALRLFASPDDVTRWVLANLALTVTACATIALFAVMSYIWSATWEERNRS